ncbi:MAG: glycosyltransferase [Nitrospirae bacterium CG18_big_fil_WC_8_21_14_2_50_70_55]|nr:MAG: hypothetical protein AUK30_00525 [Nitrospirae bacterium CG2_30_70_394]PIQ07010.1 MAG: glycosyltransferase [Nitrospirae bacterium CG18_big_fil_WC_8_21_14_2_50_70_55]PIU78360.1 MAG: glycosyltransferase [Nitrospirae bacterium CG06_land_8_20_14_3_00_70_43]PIW83860.1 MAG: glycosyltransferase [Nitrospirae bacterium CG_4_8_14_3_um_filter_70_85]PIX83014.1 MAG: glycosyltransferase [Nitrospirae bacterium CG_4_10_14_3_um_filter_70_108]PJB95420.1 MAG: glycosyltransferase [Nitrospirae bacterium CG_
MGSDGEHPLFAVHPGMAGCADFPSASPPRGGGAKTAWRGGHAPGAGAVLPLVSVVIPTLNEERELPSCLAALTRQVGPIEVVVVDGGSRDATCAIARSLSGVRVVECEAGRGRQMNAGARATRGDLLWFLHADCEPPAGAATAIRRALADPETALGAFRFALDARGWLYRVVEAGVRLRGYLLRLPYGDQGLFLRRTTFAALGGFCEEPLFEDLELVRAARLAGRVTILPLALPTSARRCQRDGIVRTTVRNQLLRLGERCGLPTARLAGLRAPVRGREPAVVAAPRPIIHPPPGVHDET